jgi:hypothetical protein
VTGRQALLAGLLPAGLGIGAIVMLAGIAWAMLAAAVLISVGVYFLYDPDIDAERRRLRAARIAAGGRR